MNFPDWGNVPAWISTGSFFIAAIAYQKSVLDKQREQATKVSAWTGTMTKDGKRKRILRITNTSDAAVYDVFIKPDRSDPILLLELPSKDSRTLDLPGDPTPAQERTIKYKVDSALVDHFVRVETRSVLSSVPPEPLPVLEFCDAACRWWRRSSQRKVQRIRRHMAEVGIEKIVENLGIYAVEVEVDGDTVRVQPAHPKFRPARKSKGGDSTRQGDKG